MGKPISQRTHKERRENDTERDLPRLATHPRRAARRVAAAERQAERAGRTNAEQVARLIAAGHHGCVEVERLGVAG